MRHAAVLGAGAWGTALANLLAGRGQETKLYCRNPTRAEELERDRENRRYLPGFPLAQGVSVSADLAAVLRGSKYVTLAVPTSAMAELLDAARSSVPEDAPLVCASKGIERQSLMLMSELVAARLGDDAERRFVCLSGPSFAREVAAGAPTSLVAASRQPELCQFVQERFGTRHLRIYSSDDPLGVQVGGALKNVIAIAVGASDGLGFGHNTRAALITRGVAEVARLAIAKGGTVLSVAGLAGLGDLVLTCTGDLSRNRTVGFELGRGRPLAEVLASLGHVAEGVTTAESAYLLGQRLGVDLPICQAVSEVLFHGKSPEAAVHDLLDRPLRREWD